MFYLFCKYAKIQKHFAKFNLFELSYENDILGYIQRG